MSPLYFVRACVCAAVLFCISPLVLAQQPTIRLATLAPKGTTYHQELLAMKQVWAKAPGGGANLIIYTDGTQGGEAAMVSRMRQGQLQAALLTVTGLTEIDDSVAALQNMPMMFRSVGELEYVRNALRPDLEKNFKAKGFIVLFWGDAGWGRFFSKKQGMTPDDFRKMKIFTWAGYTKATELWKAAGFQPVELEITDILTGLSTGLVDCVTSEPYYSLAGQFYKPAPHMLNLKWAPLVGGAVMTEKAFNTLSPQTQKVVLESAAETGKKLTAEQRKESEEAITAMKTKFGLQVHELTPELEAQWRAECEKFYPKIRGSIVPADMFDKVQSLLAEYRAQHPEEATQAKP
jgi:TRAP-type C4-dicarboxylate transport system substrate-binding protein